MSNLWSFNGVDKKLSEQLSGFLPDRIFDIHAHIYRVSDLNLWGPSVFKNGPSDISIDVWRTQSEKFLSGKKLEGGLFFPTPTTNLDLKNANNYLLSQIKEDKKSRGLVIVSPDMNPEELSFLLKNTGIAGIKPYHLFSKEDPTWESSVSGFLPEWQMKLADAHSSIVMLHLVKNKSIADPDNIKEIREMCTRYPQIKLILAHAARSFHAPHAKEGIKKLRGLDNIWFDFSGICEHEALLEILKEFGPRKLMWGSDFPVSQIRGKSVTVGDGFVWLDENFCRWEKAAFTHPVLVGIESLRAMQLVAEEFGLNEADIQDIFFENARRLLFENKHQKNLTQELYHHAKTRIPGGTQLLSKKPELMAPGRWPAYYREARGCEVWDLDGKHYYDMVTNGIGSCLLGFNDPDVTSAVRRRINLGSMSSLNSPEEVELADLLCDIHPWAEQARFTRTGGEACAVAVRIARATTNRSLVAICGYHGWHDWYLAANLGENDALKGHLLPGLNPSGVPEQLRGTALTFINNDRQSFQKMIDEYGTQLAAVIMEPCRSVEPEPGFLQFVKNEAHRSGALLIFDEITIGWRLHFGGAHLLFGVSPDLAVFAKALGNGFPIGAVIGNKEAMSGAYSSFISSTYWTEGIGPVAALATIQKMKTVDVVGHVAKVGERIKSEWERLGKKYGLSIETSGFPSLAHFTFKHDEPEKLRTIYTQMMLKKGFLAGLSIYPTWAHADEIVSLYTEAIEDVFFNISKALKNDSMNTLLEGEVAHSGFARLTK
jgi:glutamate-1-semialdehyde 2,1-aminomutase